MEQNSSVSAFWERCRDSLPEDERPAVDEYSAWSFGDNPELANELGRLVLTGRKTATCDVRWQYEAENEPIPKVGELSVVTDGTGTPLCVIETVEVETKRFDEVDEEFAFDEGEDDRSSARWREEHWRYFSRTLPRIEREPDERMPVVCERFEVVYRNE